MLRRPGARAPGGRSGRRLRRLRQRVRFAHQAGRGARAARPLRDEARRAALRDRRHHPRERAARARRGRRPARGDLRPFRRARHPCSGRAISGGSSHEKPGTLRARAAAHPGAASIRRCAPSAPSAARRGSSSAPRAPISGTPTARATSTTSARGDPMIAGHAHPAVVEAVQEAASRGALLRRADRGRDRARRAAVPAGALDRAGAPGVVGHRGDDDRAPARARLHRAQPDRQVRRLLSRPRRLAAGQGGLRRAHVRHPELGRRAGRHRRAHAGARYNDLPQVDGAVRTRGARTSPASSSSRSRAT